MHAMRAERFSGYEGLKLLEESLPCSPQKALTPEKVCKSRTGF
jgi:hypothetical protein